MIGPRIADTVDQDPLIGGLADALAAMPDSDPARVVAVADLAARTLLARPIALLGVTAAADNLAKTLSSRWRRATGDPLPEHLRAWLAELSDTRFITDPAELSLRGNRDAASTHLADLHAHITTTLRAS